MTNPKYESQIETIASFMIDDKLSIDEQDPKKLQKYHEKAKSLFNLNDESAAQLVYETLLYLKLKNSELGDPLQQGDQFGAGFS